MTDFIDLEEFSKRLTRIADVAESNAMTAGEIIAELKFYSKMYLNRAEELEAEYSRHLDQMYHMHSDGISLVDIAVAK